MSGSTIGGVVGGVIGFYFGGPQGAQLGWMIGSAVGGYVDPEQIQGPRLTDAQNQTSRDGVPITWGYGTFPTHGNLIWVQPGQPTERKTKKRQGKGGPEVTEYTYTRSFAIGICRGVRRDDGLFDPITGILLVKRYGKIVYDARPDAELLALGMAASDIQASRAASAAFLASVTFYLGGESQLPDPTIEAWEGVNNAPAHRGLVYMVARDQDVTRTEGAIQQFEFVVTIAGSAAQSCPVEANLLAWWPLDDAAAGGSAREVVAGRNGTYSATVTGGGPLNLTSAGSLHIASATDGMLAGLAYSGNPIPNVYAVPFSVSVWTAQTVDSGGNAAHVVAARPEGLSGQSEWVLGFLGTEYDEPFGGSDNGSGGGSYIYSGEVIPSAYMVLTYDGTDARLYVNGNLKGSRAGLGQTIATYIAVCDGGVSVNASFRGYVSDLKLYSGALTATQVRDNYVSAANTDLRAIPDAPGWYVRSDGRVVSNCSNQVTRAPVVLGAIAADLLKRAGLSSTQYDVSQLTDVVIGYRIASEGGIDAFLSPLMQGFFFDVAEWDAKVRCIKRGGPSVLTLTMDDLAEAEGEALEWEHIQEPELLRKVTVGYIDPEASFNAITQVFERRAGTIKALGESSLGLPIVTDKTTARQIGEKRVNVAWAENEKARFSLPIRRTALTPTDPVTIIDADNVSHRIRLMKIEEDSGVLMLAESPRERQSAYTGSVTGTTPKRPTFPGAGLIGPTQLMVMNLPVWRDADDEVGLYVAVRGLLSLWQGANLLLSTDVGVTFNTIDTLTVSATIGYTATALASWSSAQYPSTQSVTVTLPDAPESVSYATLLRYNNRAAIQLDSGAWEILQYQTVVANGNNSFTLSGLVRGRYATTPGAAASGANFVLLDSAVEFIPAERWMIGQTLTIKAASIGTDPDANTASTFAFTSAVSQTEWPVTFVQASRDASNNVTVTGYASARLGVETAPHHSQYFAGVRIIYSDAQTYDVTPNATTGLFTHTRSSAPASQTVTVAALNSITGAGPVSTGITV